MSRFWHAMTGDYDDRFDKQEALHEIIKNMHARLVASRKSVEETQKTLEKICLYQTIGKQLSDVVPQNYKSFVDEDLETLAVFYGVYSKLRDAHQSTVTYLNDLFSGGSMPVLSPQESSEKIEYAQKELRRSQDKLLNARKQFETSEAKLYDWCKKRGMSEAAAVTWATMSCLDKVFLFYDALEEKYLDK